MINKYFYVISPNEEKIARFIEKFLKNENKEGFVKVATEKIIPEDSIMSYTILDKDGYNDWYEFYLQNPKNNIIVNSF